MEEKKNYEKILIEESSIVKMYMDEEDEDKKNYKLAILIAVIAHIFLIVTVFPSVGAKEIIVKPKDKIRPPRVVIIPPVQELTDIVLNEKKVKVPVPDPNPELEEPLAIVDTYVEEVEDDSDLIVFTDKITPPDDKIILRAGTYGLEEPVYSKAELQRNAVYPPLGIKTRYEGKVRLEVVLKKDGTVGQIKVIGGIEILGFPQSAINAVKRLNFTPGKFHGKAVDVIMVLTVNYKLRKN